MPSTQYDPLFLRRAFDALQQTTGLSARVQRIGQGNAGHMALETDDARSFDFPYEVKANIDRSDQLSTFKTLHHSAVLITRSLSSTMAAQCRTLDLQFIDQAGNCFLKQPGLFAFVSGGKDAGKNKQAATRGLTPAALRVVFAVLAQPSILNSSVRRIAEIASISHGAAGAALAVLDEMGFLTNARAGRRVLAMPERWLDTWTEGYLGRMRPKLEQYRMSAPVPLPELIERVTPQMREVALGGEAAAAHLGMGLKPGALTLYIDFRDPTVAPRLVQQLKLRRDPDGHIELVEMFWNTLELPCFPTVPKALIYADLVGTGDARTMEIAVRLRKEICNHVASEA